MPQEMDLRDLFRMLKKRWVLILSTVVLGCVIAGVLSYWVMTPIYQASTKLIVNRSEDSTIGQQMSLNDINFHVRIIDTYKEIIKTPAIMDVVAEEYAQFGLSAIQLIQKVNVSTVNNSQVMTLVVEDPSYRQAAEVVNAVSLVFQREIPGIMSVDNVSILSYADEDLSPAPVRPNPILNMAIAFVVALMAAVGMVFLLEYLDDTIKSEADVQDVLGLPTLAVIHRIKEEDLLSSRRYAQRQSTSVTSASPAQTGLSEESHISQ